MKERIVIAGSVAKPMAVVGDPKGRYDDEIELLGGDPLGVHGLTNAPAVGLQSAWPCVAPMLQGGRVRVVACNDRKGHLGPPPPECSDQRSRVDLSSIPERPVRMNDLRIDHIQHCQGPVSDQPASRAVRVERQGPPIVPKLCPPGVFG